MSPNAPDCDDLPSRPTPVYAAVQIGLVALLVYACSRIIVPFAGILLWSVILAVMLYPLHLRLAPRCGNRWSALLIGLVGVVLILIPMFLMAKSLGSSLYSASIVSKLRDHGLTVPPPPPQLADVPLIGPKLTEIWSLVATNLPAALSEYGDVLSGPAGWLFSFAGGLAAGVLLFVFSFVIAAVLVAYGKGGADFSRRLLERVTGSKTRGARLLTLTAATIRGVAQGVVGVAVIQALFLGAGYVAIGLPSAGLWTLVAMLVGVVQVPLILLNLPIIIYVFMTEATQPAVIFLIWTLVAGLIDNVLRPLMLGRGLEAPMPVILIGVIGGMVVDGLLGLFVGPVLLAVGYVLLMDWLWQPTVEDAAAD